MLLLLLLWVNLLSCRRLTSGLEEELESPVKSGIADGGASARPVTADDPSQLGEPELPLTMQEAGVDWLDFEDDVPILIEMVKQSAALQGLPAQPRHARTEPGGGCGLCVRRS